MEFPRLYDNHLKNTIFAHDLLIKINIIYLETADRHTYYLQPPEHKYIGPVFEIMWKFFESTEFIVASNNNYVKISHAKHIYKPGKIYPSLDNSYILLDGNVHKYDTLPVVPVKEINIMSFNRRPTQNYEYEIPPNYQVDLWHFIKKINTAITRINGDSKITSDRLTLYEPLNKIIIAHTGDLVYLTIDNFIPKYKLELNQLVIGDTKFYFTTQKFSDNKYLIIPNAEYDFELIKNFISESAPQNIQFKFNNIHNHLLNIIVFSNNPIKHIIFNSVSNFNFPDLNRITNINARVFLRSDSYHYLIKYYPCEKPKNLAKKILNFLARFQILCDIQHKPGHMGPSLLYFVIPIKFDFIHVTEEIFIEIN